MPFKVGDVLVCECRCGLWEVLSLTPTFCVVHIQSGCVQNESYTDMYRLATKWELLKGKYEFYFPIL